MKRAMIRCGVHQCEYREDAQGYAWLSAPRYTRTQKQIWRRIYAKQRRQREGEIKNGAPVWRYRQVPWESWGTFFHVSVFEKFGASSEGEES